mmetsp:Transcript_20985/g.29625  ORF Transcript_20985/g.29625 Transcript_20985/m.29625 type:complete len:114 (-) Transcript_20985:150-491(-)
MSNTNNHKVGCQNFIYQSAKPQSEWKESTEEDRAIRRIMRHKLVKYLRHCDPTESSARRLAFMAFKIEEIFYMSSLTREEYLDPRTLKSRLQMISQGVVTLKIVDSVQNLDSP